MKRLLILAAFALCSCGNSFVFEPSSVADAPEGAVLRVEPPCWWTGMKTSLQLMIYGPGIGNAESVQLRGLDGVSIGHTTKGDSPNYIFADVTIGPKATPGDGWLVFTLADGSVFKYPYSIGEKAAGQRESFTTADMIYLIFPDRFANGDASNDSTPDTKEKACRTSIHGRHGGDIQGIIDHLDYISELGATAIWCTPLLTDDQLRGSYHGYACGDYYAIDPRMGSNALYKEMVDRCHDKGLKVIMDVVTNHCGTDHWWMKDLPFKDWIHVFPEYTGTNVAFSTNMDPNASAYDLNLQESGWFVPSMPDMNLDNPFVLKYFQQWAVWWVEYSGLDGFRVDTYPYNEKRPMSLWCKAVREEYPWINIVGECWTFSHPQLAYWQAGAPNPDGFNSNLPSIMDFPLREAIVSAISEGGDNPGWLMGTQRIYDCLSHDFLYKDLSHMMTFFANHDHGRMGDAFGHDAAKMKLALAILATVRGIPQLYNGDEMMFSRLPGQDDGDGAKRIDFPGGWEGDAVNLFSPQGRTAARGQYASAAELHDYTARLFNWRRGKSVLHNGKTMHFVTRDNTYAFFRYDDTDAVFVFINNSGSPKAVPWSHYAEIVPASVNATNVITGRPAVLSEDLTVPPFTAYIAEFGR